MARCPRCRSKVDPEFSTHCPNCGASLHAEIDDLVDERPQPPKPSPFPARPQTGIPSQRSTTRSRSSIFVIAAAVFLGGRLISNADSWRSTPIEIDSEYLWESSFDMQVGDCADSEAVLEQRSHGAEYVEYLDKQECANPHDYEVFAILQFPADTNESYPDGYALFNWAIESCREALEPYTGLPYGHRPGLDTARFPPTKVKWEQGDRNVYCLLYNADPDGTDPFPKLIGSKRANAD